MEETSKHGVFGRHQSCTEERIEVLSDTIERHYSSQNTPSLWYKVVRMETGEIVYEKENASLGLLPEISLKHDWMKEFGSEVARQVSFTPVDPMDWEHKDPETIDLGAPRLARYMHEAWKKHQDALYWVDINLPIRKGLTFYQTRSSAIILQGTLPAYCIPKVERLKTGEVLFEKAYMSPRPPPKISLRHDWTKELGSKVDHNQKGKLLDSQKEKLPDKQNSSNQPNQFQIKFVIDTQDVIVVQTCSSEDSKSVNVEQIYDRLEQLGKDTVAVQDDPELYHEAETLNINDETIRERIEADMDFRIPRLPHSIVKHTQSASVRQLIQKIENHPNRHALQRDQRQNQAYNPFSPESKQMIHEVGNIELCELLETEPKTQCKVCLSYWDIGNVYCTCGHFLREGREENQKFIKYTMDLLSIPDYVIKKGRPHGHRYGKKPGDKECYIANQLKKNCKKKCFQGIHDRFIRDEQFRSRKIENGRNEDLCRQMDALADEDHTHHLTSQEYFYYKSNWWLDSNKTGSDTMPVQRRSDFKQASSTLQQLKEKEEAQRNQRLAQSSCSSSWWSWQGS